MSPARGQNSLPTLEQVSAGGVVFRTDNGAPELVIVQIVPEMRWQLPKGLIDAGETPEQAALREVREESGITATIKAVVETIEYWFVAERDGRRIRYHKFVHFFLMNFVSGDVSDHDHEVAEARWVDLDTALEMLEFKSERDVVRKAAAVLDAHAKS